MQCLRSASRHVLVEAHGPALSTVSAHRTRRAAISRYSTIRDFFNSARLRDAEATKRVSAQLRPISSHLCSTRSFYARPMSWQQNTPSSPLQESQKDPVENQGTANPKIPEETRPPDQSYLENYSHFFRRLALSVPHLTRPTRDDLLNVTSSFWNRLRIRFKWSTIRSFRKFNADDISAFFSFVLVGNTLWILIGTTTFFSVVIATINSLRLQSWFARAISDYLTHETGIAIVFESAIVPKWKGSRISFKNVYISRRPRRADLLASPAELGKRAAARIDVGHGPAFHEEDELPIEAESEDVNYSMFDVNIDSVDVTLSLTQWLDGKGLIKDAEVKGVRGVLDRRNVHWDPEKPLDPADFRREAHPGDFHLESLKLEDVLITVHQPGGFRPYTASIFRADLQCLRKQWLIYDFLRADNMVGQIDNCLFSLHRPQSIGRTVEADTKGKPWERMARFRIDSLNIDHLQAATGTSDGGPISWITSGKIDAVLDIAFPREPSEDFDINAIVTEIAANISTLTSTDRLPGQRVLAKPALSAPSEDDEGSADPTTHVYVDIDLRFRDVKAAVPLFANELSSVNSALIRPIVAFINANRTLIPIRARVTKDLGAFDGSWTLWEAGVLDSIASKTYEALAFHVTQANMNRRIRTVSLWSLQQTAKAVVRMLRAAMDPIASQLRTA